ncbi:5996_t:CDS:2 [Cetraspora pellucida]|uniref:5996_t:CDS:1 n=1 Tax=Cetraspora pellucida TaxID=1433469 RepID=A0A9N9GHF4_9GLOM|nr:5996_t:CDS:2 [Cetraspora pellucida]
MANNTQNTSSTHSQNIQYGNISMPIQPQSQLRDKIQQNSLDEKRQKKVVQHGHKRKLMENEKDKQKAEYESSRNELKSLLSQYGSKAKVADDLEKDANKIRGSIENLLSRVQSNKLNVKPISQSTPPPPPPQQIIAVSQYKSLYSNFGFYIIDRVLYSFAYLGKSHHTYLYIEPYEPVVHGTFGIDQPAPFGLMWSVINSVKDFFAEVINGGRGFGNPNYDGFVPI